MKVKVKNHSRLINFVIITMIALFIFNFSWTTKTYSNTMPKEVMVRTGDTLWKIAEQNYPNEYLPKKTYEIAEINNIIDGNIYPGQRLILP